MISPVLSNKIFNKINRLLLIDSDDKIFLPIIDNAIDLENLLKFYPNKLIISLPNYAIYSKILRHKSIAENVSKREIEINIDFFGISGKIHPKDITKTIIFFPNNTCKRSYQFCSK